MERRRSPVNCGIQRDTEPTPNQDHGRREEEPRKRVLFPLAGFQRRLITDEEIELVATLYEPERPDG